MAATATSAGTGNWSADATWAITGIGDSSGGDGDLNTGVLDCTGDTPGFTVDALIGRRVQLAGGTWYTITDNDANTITIDSPPADGDPLAWLLGGSPLAGDAVVIATTHTVVFNVARAPATSGTFASLTNAGTGTITIAPTTLGYDVTIAATTFQAVAAPLITVSAAAHTGRKVTTIGNVIGGSSASAICFVSNATATTFLWDHTGSITGGGASVAYGFNNASTGGVAVTNGNIAGGSATGARGFSNASTGVVTLTNVNLIDTATNSAYVANGKAPVWVITDKANYIQMPTVNADGRGSWVMRFYLAPHEHEVLASTAGGFEDGANPPSYVTAGTYHAALAAEVLDTVSFGAASAETGTVHLPAVGEVISTASFGAASAQTGTYHVCAVGEVLDTVSFGALSAQTGTVHLPAVGEVISTASFGAGSALTGTYVVVAQDDAVYKGAGYYGVTGSLIDGHYVGPVRADVLDSASGGTAYSAAVDYHGTYHAPLAAEVLDTVSFGAASAETGTYHAPLAAEVISTATFGVGDLTPGEYDVSEVVDTNILVGASIGGVAGAEIGSAAQLVIDVAAVSAELHHITTDVVNLLDAANDGELDMSLYALIPGGGALADLAEYEDKTQRRYFRRGREGVYLRVYDVPLNVVSSLPKAGAFFPGDNSGPRITSDGVNIGPVVTKGSHTATRITISATTPAYTAATDEKFTHGL